MILDIISFIAILTFLVIAHEAGHFSTARFFKMYVEEFAIGFPPRLFSKKKGETLFSINAVPVGGYVKIPGENGKEAMEEELRTQPQKQETIPEERYFYTKPAWQRIVVLLAGVTMNFLIGWIFLSAVFMIGVPRQVYIAAIAPDSPAAQAGLEAGDILPEYESSQAFIEATNQHLGKEFTFKVQDKETQKDITLTPRQDPPQGQGAMGVVLQETGVQREGFLSAIGKAFKEAWGICTMIFVLIAHLIASIISGEEIFSQLAGPIGIYQVTAQAADMGIVYLLNLIALISLNLAALNIFPFPALDGGRILFILIEKIKGSPVKMKTQLWFNGIGFVILILFIIAVSIQDISRIW